MGTEAFPGGQWDALALFEPQSPWLCIQQYLIKGTDPRKMTNLQKIQRCVQTVVELEDEQSRELVADQLHPSVKGLITVAARLQCSEVPASLSTTLIMELAALKYKGTSGMREAAEESQHRSNLLSMPTADVVSDRVIVNVTGF